MPATTHLRLADRLTIPSPVPVVALLLWFVGAIATAAPCRAQSDTSPPDGTHLAPGAAPGIGADERAAALQAIAAFNRSQGPPTAALSGTPPKFPFLPMAGEINQDIFTAAYVDVDTNAGTQNAWNCIPELTYDGHMGTDTVIRSFGEQAIGVPIFAALDGTVCFVRDGQPDMNTVWVPGTLGNAVIIDHGFGRTCWYWHFKQWSIDVMVGDTVKAGQQLGLTGSSGFSNWPHLHFEVYDNQVRIDPYAGPCGMGPSAWANQPPFFTDLRFMEFNITADDPANYPPKPFALPASGTFVQGQQDIWVHGLAWPVAPGSSYSLRLLRPNGTIAENSTGNWGGGRGDFYLPLPGANLDVTGS